MSADTVNVPREPTEAMLAAGCKQLFPDIMATELVSDIYRAMLSAALKEGEGL